MKTVSVPTSHAALQRLDLGLSEENDLTEHAIPLRDFDVLFSSGWVSSVNRAIGANIDDFEDAHITDPDEIRKLIEISELFQKENDDHVFQKIADLARLALGRATGIHFFF